MATRDYDPYAPDPGFKDTSPALEIHLSVEDSAKWADRGKLGEMYREKLKHHLSLLLLHNADREILVYAHGDGVGKAPLYRVVANDGLE
jgi:hypothetical protein